MYCALLKTSVAEASVINRKMLSAACFSLVKILLYTECHSSQLNILAFSDFMLLVGRHKRHTLLHQFSNICGNNLTYGEIENRLGKQQPPRVCVCVCEAASNTAVEETVNGTTLTVENHGYI